MSTNPHAASSSDPARESRGRWNPLLVGAGIGILSWLVFAVVDKPLGMSTALSQVSGSVTAIAAGEKFVADNPYWKKHLPAWDYGTLFMVGTFLGALVSAIVSRSFRVEAVPTVWEQRFGPAKWKRYLAAFVGGTILMYGARLAGGCTSGHGISGSLQLALSSWVFFLTMFVTGLLTALVMFGKPGTVGGR